MLCFLDVIAMGLCGSSHQPLDWSCPNYSPVLGAHPRRQPTHRFMLLVVHSLALFLPPRALLHKSWWMTPTSPGS